MCVHYLGVYDANSSLIVDMSLKLLILLGFVRIDGFTLIINLSSWVKTIKEMSERRFLCVCWIISLNS